MSIIKDIFSVSRKTFFNPSRWIDAEGLGQTSKFLINLVRTATEKPEVVEREVESFESVLSRMQLTEGDIAEQIKAYRIYAIILVTAGILVFLYGFFLLFKYKTLAGWILSLAASALAFAFAFRYDFWAFQMRKRKLGLSFEEYKKFLLNDKGNA